MSLPPIGAKIRVTSKRPDGTTVTIEGVVSSHPMNSGSEWVEVGKPGVCAYMTPDADDRTAGATVVVKVLSLPEPEAETWVHVRQPDTASLGHIFRRADAFRAAYYPDLGDELKWWWYGNGSWETWDYVQGLGEVEVLRAGAR